MYKQQLIVLSLVLLLALAQPTILLPSLAEPMAYQELNPNPMVGSGAGEEKDIDTFEVHPASGRWDILNSGFTSTVVGSYLEMTDIGDDTADYYRIDRNLQDLDDTIQVRFKVIVNDSCTSTSDYIRISLYGNSDYSKMVDFIYTRMTDIDNTQIRYYDVDSTLRTLNLPSAEKFANDTWYRVRIDYDLPRSEMQFRGYFDNGTRVFDYDWQDVSAYVPVIFSYTTISVAVVTGLRTDGVNIQSLWDYVEAPFAEREWVQYGTPTDSDWIYDSIQGHTIQDDIDDSSGYKIFLPEFDGLSVTFDMEVDAVANLVNGDRTHFYWSLYSIQASDGSGTQCMGFDVDMVTGAGGTKIDVEEIVDEVQGTGISSSPSAATNGVTVNCVIQTANNRKDISMSLEVDFWDASPDGQLFYETTLASTESSEFYLLFATIADFDGDTTIRIHREEYAVMQDSVGMDIAMWFMGITAQIGMMLIGPLLIWLGGVFKSVGEWIVGVLNVVEDAINALAPLFSPITDFLEDCAGYLSDLVNDLGSDIGDYLLGLVNDFIEDGIAILLALVEYVWGFIAGLVFWVWDTLGLPDLLAIVEVLLTGFIQLVNGLPNFLIALIVAIIILAYLIPSIGLVGFFGLPLAQGDIGGYFDAMLRYMNFDITFGISIFGFQVHIPAVAVWLVISLGTVLSGTTFAGFFP